MTRIPDQKQRLRALDPATSFIVQAPAGSGKTGLLIQRYLGLLAVVAEPEEILAITFTRKAAAELRHRIQMALHDAREEVQPGDQRLDDDHWVLTRKLAAAVVKRDEEKSWGLYQHPVRLRVGTIDSVNGRLAASSPLSSGTISLNRKTDDANALYQEAARKTLSLAVDSDQYGQAVGRLLRHLGNSTERFERRIIAMLASRDQWLRVVGSGAVVPKLRQQLEYGLKEMVERSLAGLRQVLPDECDQLIVTLMDYAARNLHSEKPDSIVIAWAGRNKMPDPVSEELALWKGLAATLLTSSKKNKTWRKAPNKNLGFPPSGKEQKQQLVDLIKTLADTPLLKSRLAEAASLPEPFYTHQQWEILEALLTVLPVAAAHLKLVFAARGETDFVEIAHEALQSLGEEGRPSELGLSLDYRISHILVDEFQDTSRTQFHLLGALTRGWVPGDGRTLFLVGDPMQSIYRFREADVSLYTRARHSGIGEVKLEPLKLAANFRSEPAIVEWTNTVFDCLCDEPEDIGIGAVSFGASVAVRPASTGSGVHLHWCPHNEKEEEAERIVGIVRECLAASETEDVAILVRSRSHALATVSALRKASISFQGRGLDSLGQRSVVQDLTALTRSLSHVGDRLAWLALLRSPWFGLSLVDLHALATFDLESTVWGLLNNSAAMECLSEDGRLRIDRQKPHIANALNSKGRYRLRDWVEGVWQELGGAATITGTDDFDCVNGFFDYLDRVDSGGDCADVVDLIEPLSKQPFSAPLTKARVQIMTMHKAKGLEFDTVILPGLGYQTRVSDRPALLLSQEADNTEHECPVLAPIGESGAEDDPIHDFLWNFEQQQDRREQIRLLYVATTRAKKQLHLFAQLGCDKDSEIKPPAASTLLGRLWPAIEDSLSESDADIIVQHTQRMKDRGSGPDWLQIPIQRLPMDWQRPAPPESCTVGSEAVPSGQQALVFDWASRWAMQVGSVVHLCLQYITATGADDVDLSTDGPLRLFAERMLKYKGTDQDSLDRAVNRVMTALATTLADERGRWILSDMHHSAASELPVTVCDQQGFRNLVLDRTFLCEKGDRWIIDYKTSSHEGGDLNAFLESEAERYRPQLAAYRDAMARQGSEQIRTALYFPLLGVFHEVDTGS